MGVAEVINQSNTPINIEVRKFDPMPLGTPRVLF